MREHLLDLRRLNDDQLIDRKNIFIIHGSDEAKWRELKGILKDEFCLNPIVLKKQTNEGCMTVIENFEHYAERCAYAIAVITPDDQVIKANGVTYHQARPNVIYEIGWFCGRLGRERVMLMLKKGTELFSDFGGILTNEFNDNISERKDKIRKALISAGILKPDNQRHNT